MTGIQKSTDSNGRVTYTDGTGQPASGGKAPTLPARCDNQCVGRIKALKKKYPHLRDDQAHDMVERENAAAAKKQRDQDDAEAAHLRALEIEEQELAEAENALNAGELAKELILPQDAADWILMAGGVIGKAPKAGKILYKVADKGKTLDALRKRRKKIRDAIDAAKANKAKKTKKGTVVEKKAAAKKNKPRQPRQYEKKVENMDGSTTYTLKTKDGKLVDVTYRDGYPDFDPYKYEGKIGKPEVEIKMTGDNNVDFAAANKEAGFGSGVRSHPDGYTWHHNQDGKTMQLVRTEVHSVTPHTGGASAVK